MLGPLLDSGGERDEAGRGPLKHTPKVLFMSMLDLTENAHSLAQRCARTTPTGQTQTDNRHSRVGEVDAKTLSRHVRLYNRRKMLSHSGNSPIKKNKLKEFTVVYFSIKKSDFER